ncbi:protein POLAR LOCALIZATION DURING ASYMMETRIC DIVISION AND REDISTRIBUTION-like isoform X1 [Canna indica]|uniref:Protein POLAR LOCALIZATION DURING ASYMMETRIC DIVISION AND REDISTRIBUTION-like isoform X1 n=1 Tax=Canna indica TaxID=4628 RepID=A0AAQ3QMH5_9LILI|nr:protein POLAR LOCALIZATION DURING ASYMMETRIC DIVISION AND REDISTRIBUTION-like isoform X1 [Canna indica]
MEPFSQGSSSRSLGAFGAPAAAVETEKMRIVDWLRDPDEQDDKLNDCSRQRRDLCAVVSSGAALRKFLPKSIFRFKKRQPDSCSDHICHGRSRSVPFLRCRQKRKGKEPGEVLREDGTEKLSSSDSKTMEGISGGASDSSLQWATGRNPEETSFNLGMGIAMAFMLSRWETEFKKLKELQFEMEVLLKEIRDKVATKDVTSGIMESYNKFSSSSSDCSLDVSKCNSTSFQNHRTIFQMEEANSTAESDRHSDDQISIENQSMDQLEAELIFELEQLQLNLERKDSAMLSERERLELAYETTSSSESSKHQEEYDNVHCGVSASELERRLYELIHTRQQEEIAELESELELTKKMLVDKETEVSWWKDTASLSSPHHEEILCVNSCEREHNIIP